MTNLFTVDSVNTNSLLAVTEAVNKKNTHSILAGVCFRANKERYALHVCATDCYVFTNVIYNDVSSFDLEFESIVIDSENLKQILSKYKNMNVPLTVAQENNDYFMFVGADKYLIKTLEGNYPNTENIKFCDSDDDCCISLTTDVLERLLKTLKTSKKDFIDFRFKSQKQSNFKVKIGSNINIVATCQYKN